jgi:hypothetical protein
MGGGSIANSQTMTIGSAQGVSGLTSASDVLLKALGSSSDLKLDQPLVSSQGNIVAVAGRHFLNTVAADAGLSTPGGRYVVYSSEPTTLPSSVESARGMSSGFSKRYAQSFTGTTPAYAGQGNWFLYATTPTLNITPINGSFVYGETGSNTYDVSGLIDGDLRASALLGTPLQTGTSFAASASGNRPVGTYGVSLTGQGTLQSPLGYAINLATGSGTLTVTPRPVNVSALTGQKVYGESDPALLYTSEAATTGRGLLTGDAFTGAPTRSAGETVSGGPYVVSKGTLANSNYLITFTDGALTVTPRPVSVTADQKSKVYGDADPSLTFVAEAAGSGRGLLSSDTLSGSLSRSAGETVSGGPYAITQGTLGNPNYAVNYTDGALSVIRAPLTVSADDKNRRFGEANPALTFTANAAQLKLGDTASVVRNVVFSAPTTLSLLPGDYPIKVSEAQADNYTLTFIDGILTVKPVPMERAENLIVQLSPVTADTSTVVSMSFPVPAPSAVPSTNNSAANLEPGILATRDGGMSPPPRAGSAGVEFVAGPASGMGGLAVNLPISDVRIDTSSPFRIQIPQNAFVASRPDATVTLSAQLANGATLPSWLSFDARTGTLQGTPPAGVKGELAVRIVARDERGNQAVQTFKISVTGRGGGG